MYYSNQGDLPLLVAGWMKKMGGAKGGSKNWKKRWFRNEEADPFTITYHTSSNAKKSNQKVWIWFFFFFRNKIIALQGEVDLHVISRISFTDEADGSLNISVTTPERVWEFASDAEEKVYWRTMYWTDLFSKEKVISFSFRFSNLQEELIKRAEPRFWKTVCI